MSVASKIAFNTAISVSARMLGMVFALVGIGFVTRYLGPEGFGEYSTILAFLFIFSIVADLGLQQIMVREISKPEADEAKIVGNVFGLKIAAAAVIFAAAGLIVYLFPYSENVKKGALIVGAANFFGSLIQLLSGVFQKHLRTDKMAFAEIVARVAQTGLIIFFVWKDFGFLPIVATIAVSNLLNFAMIFSAAKKFVDFKIGADFVFWKKTLKMSLPIGISALFTLVYFKFNTIILSLIKTQTEVGLFSAAYKVLETSIFIPAMFVGLLMPFFSKYAVSDRPVFARYFQRSFDIISIIALPLVFGGIFFSEEIMNLLGGEKFLPAADSLAIIMVATGFIFYGNLFGNALIALEKQKKLMFIYAVGAVLSVFLNVVFIRKYSYVGAAGVTAGIEALVVALMIFLFYRTAGFFPNFKIFSKGLLASVIMSFAIAALKSFGFAAAFVSASLVYLAAIFLIGGITKDELKMIFKKPL